MESNKHYVATHISVIADGTPTRRMVIQVQTREGDAINLYLTREAEEDLRVAAS